jgi:hypothetical protein
VSKLAHSNDATMEEIEFRSRGLTKLPPPPKGPQCEAATVARWYRPNGGRCPYEAKYINSGGRQLCRIHAQREDVLIAGCGCRLGECENKTDSVCRLREEIGDGHSQ